MSRSRSATGAVAARQEQPGRTGLSTDVNVERHRKVDHMFKTVIAAIVLAMGIVLAGATSAMADTAPTAPATCPTDMHWTTC